MSEDNPYAPPEAGGSEGKKTKVQRPPAGDVAEALDRLNAHLSDPANVAAERAAAGGRIRSVTIVFIAIAVLMIPVLVTVMDSGPRLAVPLAIIGTVVSVLLSLALVIVDLTVPTREQLTSPDLMAKSFLRAMSMGRHGYAWACLSPTAREGTVRSPNLAPVPTKSGTFTLRSPVDVKAFSATFTRAGAGNLRGVQVRRASVVEEKGDVATVEVHALFQAWPQWAVIIGAIGSSLLGAAGVIVWLVVFLTLRKTREVTFQKTLLRGSNGLWYAYAADPFDGQVEPL
ncbi:hypothetical protein [Polyangium aurulentum]|uniref:hypothetical protein n=1 Tax=Polyangium aurulentum TaxID=2567896 RepID=UPI0010AE6108|nr:hypothetical protein [Polyangium aurulentum]UQA58435.1 hypothetical protein E8A73_045520 [Polyangium aurulentum]